MFPARTKSNTVADGRIEIDPSLSMRSGTTRLVLQRSINPDWDEIVGQVEFETRE
jgi:hypothetical protein